MVSVYDLGYLIQQWLAFFVNMIGLKITWRHTCGCVQEHLGDTPVAVSGITWETHLWLCLGVECIFRDVSLGKEEPPSTPWARVFD